MHVHAARLQLLGCLAPRNEGARERATGPAESNIRRPRLSWFSFPYYVHAIAARNSQRCASWSELDLAAPVAGTRPDAPLVHLQEVNDRRDQVRNVVP